MRRIFIGAVLVAFVVACDNPRTAIAANMTAGALVNLCQSDDLADRRSCHGYIAGIIDYHRLIKSLGTAPGVDFCIPDGVKFSTITNLVVTYIQRQNQHKSFIASPAVTLALYDRYPCGK
jgi:hypothetical protein